MKKSVKSGFLKYGIYSGLVFNAGFCNAAEFNFNDLAVSFDSTFSFAQAWRLEQRNYKKLVGKANNPVLTWDNSYPYNPRFNQESVWLQDGAYSTNSDSGNLHYDLGDRFTNTIQGTHHLKLDYKNYGALLSFMYFKDLEASERIYEAENSDQTVTPCDNKSAARLLCDDIRLLDSYIYFNTSLNHQNNPVSIRVGKQVLAWGESKLIPNGINVNAIDLVRKLNPVSTLEESYIPTGMVWTNIGLGNNVAIEFYYQYEWQESYLPVAGSYFSVNDTVGAGSDDYLAQFGFGSYQDLNTAGLINGLQTIIAELPQVGQIESERRYLSYVTNYGLINHRHINKASGVGQYGVKLNWLAEPLNFSEFAIYYLKYHSRLPLVSVKPANYSSEAIQNDIITLSQSSQELTKPALYDLSSFSQLLLEYPEDIELVAASFSSSIYDVAIAGEISYRKNQPVQIDDAELALAAVAEQLAAAQIRPEYEGISQLNVQQNSDCQGLIDQRIQGYCRLNVWQGQLSLTKQFGTHLFFDNLAAVAEFAYLHVTDLPKRSELRLNAPGTDRAGGRQQEDNLEILYALQNGPALAQEQNFPTENSFGYRMQLTGYVTGVLGELHMHPKLFLAHDIKGVSPEPISLFYEGRQKVGVSVEFGGLGEWSLELGYNSFYGGVSNINQLEDRDYFMINFKFSI